jgi:glycosyltransferase involved in cell wall biosynthesis
MKQDNKKIRIAMLISQFYPIIGGAEIQCYHLSKELIKLGVHVEIITPKINKSSPTKELLDGVTVVRLPFLHPVELNLAVWLAYLWKNRNNYDIFHIHLINRPHTVAAWIIAKLFQKRVIIKFANTGHRFDLLMTKKDLRPPLSILTQKAVRSADKIIAICKQVEIELIDNGIKSDRIVSIPNGVMLGNETNNQKRSKIRKKLSLPENKIIILRIGTLSNKKGIPVLLDAFEEVLKKCPNTYLLSVGGNYIPQALTEYQQTYPENVCFLLNQTDVIPFYQASDIFVLPSLTEGLSNALLEAQSVGLPAVVTSVGGNTDVIKHGINGLVVEPGNKAQLSRALIDLVISKEKRKLLSQKTLEVIKKFNLTNISEQYYNLYLSFT